MTASDLLEQPCNKSDNINKVVTAVNKLCSKLVDNLEQAVRTQLVGGLLAHLLSNITEIFACCSGSLFSLSLVYNSDLSTYPHNAGFFEGCTNGFRSNFAMQFLRRR